MSATTVNDTASTDSTPALFRNKTALKKFIQNHDGATTDDLVKAINIKLMLAVLADNEGHHHRLDAGRMLVELRTRVEGDGEKWWTWQEGKFDRSRKDMEKLMRMARADDPDAAAEAEREGTRARMQKLRKIGAHVRSGRPPWKARAAGEPDKVVGAFGRELADLLDEYCSRLEAFVEEHPGLNDEGRGCLVQVLELYSNRLQELAQFIDGQSGEADE